MRFPLIPVKLGPKLRLMFGVLLLLSYEGVERNLGAQETLDDALALDEYQRSTRIYHYRWFQGSDASRGEELYFFKCWMCHNEYTIAEDYPLRAPTLVRLYQRPTLLSGEPVNDETVARKIWTGGPGMPSYRHALSEDDMTDLLRYLREDCCWDEDNPPVNPWYRAGDD